MGITRDEAEDLILTNQKPESGDSTNRKTVFSWTEACIAREEESLLWGAQGSSGALGMRATVCSNAHYSSVDCVKVIREGKLVVSRPWRRASPTTRSRSGPERSNEILQ